MKVTLNLTIPENPRLIRVTVEDENPAHDPDDTVLDLQQWCSINSVPKEATLTLVSQRTLLRLYLCLVEETICYQIYREKTHMLFAT